MAEGPADPGTKSTAAATPTLKELLNALDSVVDWYSLGVKLGLEDHELSTVERNYHGDGNERCKLEMLVHWLRNTKLPTWKAVADALHLIGEHKVALKTRTKYCSSSTATDTRTPPPIGPQSPSAIALAQRNSRMIKGKFASLVTKSRSKLQSRNIDVKDVQMFLFTMYSSSGSGDGSVIVTVELESARSLEEIFRTLSKHGLWDYLNYYLLQTIIEQFAGDDDELNGMMEQYQQDLTGYILTLRIQMYLDYEYPITTTDIDVMGDPALLKKLTAKCKINVTNHTLTYVSNLWRSLAKQFALPQLVVILHHIAEGFINPMEIKKAAPQKKSEESTEQSGSLDSPASDDYYLSICEQVMHESGAMNQIIMHCIFVGPAGAGKSSLLRRLLRMKLDPRCSTQAAEKSVRVEIKNVSRTAAQVTGLDWQKIDDPISQASGLIGQLSTNQLEKHEEDSSAQASRPVEQLSANQEKAIKEDSHSMEENPSEFITEPEETVDITETKIELKLPEHTLKSPDSEQCTTSKSSDSEQLQHSQSQFGKAIEFLRHVLKEKGVSGLQQHVSPWTLYLTDSGGQPEFQELLPALVAGPCIFFIVFPLDKDLKKKYEVEYVRPDENKRMQKYLSSLTLQEDIMRSLASIACTNYKDIDGNEVEPRVMLVATFKDQVPREEDRQRRLKELQDMVEETDAFRQGMIVEASETQMVFTINNVSDDESEKDAKEIRDAFQILANADDFKVYTPSPWLIFGILVQHVHANDSVISKQDCFKLAQECGIKNESEFEGALQFLFKQTGVLHYYVGLPELSQIVIRDPQHLFSRVNQLVEKTFTFEEIRARKCTEEFKRGLFSGADYKTLTKKSNSSKLTPSMLLKLLEYLHVVVPLGDSDKYFMPCAIAHLDEDSAAQSTTIPPLLITFKSGYCPKGLFGALVTCIANKQVQANCTLDLDESQIHRDQICFTMGLYKLLLRIKPTYIYIEVIPGSGSKEDASLSTCICTLCNSIRKLIEANIAEACKTLCYSDCANYGLSFLCQCDPHSQEKKAFHPAQIIKTDPVQGRIFLCSRSKKSTPVNPECHVWLPEPNILQHPKSLSVVAGTVAVFEVKATGDDLHFQWQKNRSDLCDGGRYCDTDTDTLRIVEVETDDRGRYRCIVKNHLGTKPSDEASLTISFPSRPTPPTSMLQQFAYPTSFQYPPSQQLYVGDLQQGAHPQYRHAPSVQAGQVRGHISDPAQQLPGCYTILPQQLPYQQLPTTRFTGMRQGVAPPPCMLQPDGQYASPGSPQSLSSHRDTSLTCKNISQMLTELLDWHTLGTKLDLPFHTVKKIRLDYNVHGTDWQKQEMINEWLAYDTEASWSKLASALDEMENHTLSKKIRDKYIPDYRSAVSTQQGD